MGLQLTPQELEQEATPSQKRAIARITAHGELPLLDVELWHRGVLCVTVGQSRRIWTITPRGKTDEIK